jgi:hypothetical protein
MTMSSALGFEHTRCFFILNQHLAKWLDGHSRTFADQGRRTLYFVSVFFDGHRPTGCMRLSW